MSKVVYLRTFLENVFIESQDFNLNMEFLIEMNIIYSEVYMMPTLYFLIYDKTQNKYIEVEEYFGIIKRKGNESSVFILKSYEILKTVMI
jgi:hypothetical protein